MLDGVSVAIGPGSFTGLRVGLAVAKGICWSLNLPLMGVSSLLAIALASQMQAKRIVPLKDARRNEFYYAAFIKDDDLQQTIPDSIGPVQSIVQLMADGYVPVGPGIPELWKYISRPELLIDEGYDRNAIGGVVAQAGLEGFMAGKTLDLASATPNYIRISRPREWKS